MKNKNLLLYLGILILASIFVRIAFLGYSTLNHTEGENAMGISYVLGCFNRFPFIQGLWRLWHIFLKRCTPLMTEIIIGTPMVSIFGLNEFVVRLKEAIAGVLTILLVYVLVKRHSDKLTSLFVMALLAFNPFLITFNRFSTQDSVQSVFILTGILFLDIFTINPKPKIIFLILSSFFFTLGFLVKYNAAIMIIIAVVLYFFIFELKLKYVISMPIFISIFLMLLFFDQKDKLLDSIGMSLRYIDVSPRQTFNDFVGVKLNAMAYATRVYIRGYLLYFEQTVMPLLIAMFFLREIENKLFKFMFFFSILYFGTLFLQGRGFYRYLQIGIITASVAFAFPLRKIADKKHFYAGIYIVAFITLWSFVSHSSYILSQYHHIPYADIVKISKASVGKDNSIVLYGRNGETEFYFSPDGTLYFDGRFDPLITDTIPANEDTCWRNDIKKIPKKVDNLFNPNMLRHGDILVVSGMQMDGGEPNPKSLGIKINDIRLWGIREYGHRLEDVADFYGEYKKNIKLQENFVLLNKIYLTNNSSELAALILKRK